MVVVAGGVVDAGASVALELSGGLAGAAQEVSRIVKTRTKQIIFFIKIPSFLYQIILIFWNKTN